VTLPYPHARNDCGACRERDADVQLLGAEYEQPGRQPQPHVLCQSCLGSHLALRAIHLSGDGLDGPVTFTMTVAPGRRPGPPDPRPAITMTEAIRRAYARAAGADAGSWVMLGDLRRQLGGLPRYEVDHALTQMYMEGSADLVPNYADSELTDADRAAVVLINGERRHRIVIRDAGR
jgi:hypothetical protein